MPTFSSIIDSFGGPAQFAVALGITANHAGVMKARNSIPPEYWSRLVAAAAERGIDGVTLEALAAFAERRRPTAAEHEAGSAERATGSEGGAPCG